MHQNITLKLEKHLLREAKGFAAQEGTSLSRLMVEALRVFLERTKGYEKAKTKALSYLRKGWKMGGGPYYPSRDVLHSRHGR